MQASRGTGGVAATRPTPPGSASSRRTYRSTPGLSSAPTSAGSTRSTPSRFSRPGSSNVNVRTPPSALPPTFMRPSTARPLGSLAKSSLQLTRRQSAQPGVLTELPPTTERMVLGDGSVIHVVPERKSEHPTTEAAAHLHSVTKSKLNSVRATVLEDEIDADDFLDLDYQQKAATEVVGTEIFPRHVANTSHDEWMATVGKKLPDGHFGEISELLEPVNCIDLHLQDKLKREQRKLNKLRDAHELRSLETMLREKLNEIDIEHLSAKLGTMKSVEEFIELVKDEEERKQTVAAEKEQAARLASRAKWWQRETGVRAKIREEVRTELQAEFNAERNALQDYVDKLQKDNSALVDRVAALEQNLSKTEDSMFKLQQQLEERNHLLLQIHPLTFAQANPETAEKAELPARECCKKHGAELAAQLREQRLKNELIAMENEHYATACSWYIDKVRKQLGGTTNSLKIAKNLKPFTAELRKIHTKCKKYEKMIEAWERNHMAEEEHRTNISKHVQYLLSLEDYSCLDVSKGEYFLFSPKVNAVDYIRRHVRGLLEGYLSSLNLSMFGDVLQELLEVVFTSLDDLKRMHRDSLRTYYDLFHTTPENLMTLTRKFRDYYESSLMEAIKVQDAMIPQLHNVVSKFFMRESQLVAQWATKYNVIVGPDHHALMSLAKEHKEVDDLTHTALDNYLRNFNESGASFGIVVETKDPVARQQKKTLASGGWQSMMLQDHRMLRRKSTYLRGGFSSPSPKWRSEHEDSNKSLNASSTRSPTHTLSFQLPRTYSGSSNDSDSTSVAENVETAFSWLSPNKSSKSNVSFDFPAISVDEDDGEDTPTTSWTPSPATSFMARRASMRAPSHPQRTVFTFPSDGAD